MASKSDAFVPYATPEELAKGKRRAARYLVIAAAALVLAVVADRVVVDEQLQQVYLLAGLLHLVAAIGPILRITRTGEPEPVE